ncbi:MAG: ribosome silencing factor [Tepidisphaeraceae bacterium]
MPSTAIAPPASRTEAARKFAIDVATLAANTRCHNVVILDVRGISPVTDYFVLATGTSPRQMKSVCDEAGEFGDTQNYAPLNQCGTEGDSWMLIDFVDVVLHVFSQESRMFYDLDGLWGDARKVEWKQDAVEANAPR